MRCRPRLVRLFALSLWATASLCACGETRDAVGYDVPPLELRDFSCPAKKPTNHYGRILFPNDSEADVKAMIDQKLAAGFSQLFYGNEAMGQNIYYPLETDPPQAYIYDSLHKDYRTEGLGLGLLITLSLNKQDEFDRLWRRAKSFHQIATGPAAGYFASSCNTTDVETRPCVDPYGLEQFTTALLLAWKRWPGARTGIDYGAEALALLALMRTKVIQNGGIVDGVTGSFDEEAFLLYDEPTRDRERIVGTALPIAPYYELWAEVTGDPFYIEAARAAREFLVAAAHPTTGLYPSAAHFDGSPVSGFRGDFAAEAFRVYLNFALDAEWGIDEAHDDYQGPIANRILAFFSGEGIDSYGSSYTLDGRSMLKKDHAAELVMANGVLAPYSAVSDRQKYVSAAWNQYPPMGSSRYFTGLMYLMGNLLLSGRLALCP